MHWGEEVLSGRAAPRDGEPCKAAPRRHQHADAAEVLPDLEAAGAEAIGGEGREGGAAVAPARARLAARRRRARGARGAASVHARVRVRELRAVRTRARRRAAARRRRRRRRRCAAREDRVAARPRRRFGTGPRLHYADARRGQRRTMRMSGEGGSRRLEGFLLAGDISAEAWIRPLLQEERPADAYGRSLLVAARSRRCRRSRAAARCAAASTSARARSRPCSRARTGRPTRCCARSRASSGAARTAARACPKCVGS